MLHNLCVSTLKSETEELSENYVFSHSMVVETDLIKSPSARSLAGISISPLYSSVEA